MKKMRINALRVLLFFSFIWLVACGAEEDTRWLIDDANQSELLLSDGGSFRFEEVKGYYVLVNYWAEWCRPCLAEIPVLNELQDSYGDSLKVFGVNYDGKTGIDLENAIEALGINFPVFVDDPSVRLGDKPIVALPETVLINDEGRVVYVLRGEQTLISLELALEKHGWNERD